MATIFMKNGHLKRASALAEESGDFILAADLYANLGMRERAACAPAVLPDDLCLFSHNTPRGVIQGGREHAAYREKYLQGINGAVDSSNPGFATTGRRLRSAKDLKTYILPEISARGFQVQDVTRGSNTAHEHDPLNDPPARGEGPQNTSDSVREAEKHSVLQEIRQGGMGVVYKAKDFANKVIALGSLQRHKQPQRLSGLRPRRSAASLNHPT
jgi:hypothetical protein